MIKVFWSIINVLVGEVDKDFHVRDDGKKIQELRSSGRFMIQTPKSREGRYHLMVTVYINGFFTKG